MNIRRVTFFVPLALSLSLILGGLGGCASNAAANTDDDSGDSTSPDTSSDSFPADCDIALVLTVDGGSSATVAPEDALTFTVTARDLSGSGATLRIPDRCPSGNIAFSGLENDDGFFDYYQTCAAGACMPNLPPSEYVIPPGGEAQVASTEIRGAGCNDALSTGTHSVSVVLPIPQGDPLPQLCASAPVTVVVE